MFVVTPVFAESERDEVEILHFEESDVDFNHIEVIEKINQYVEEHVDDDMFASLHIDRMENPKGKIVLSFTEEPTEQMKEELTALADGSVELVFRVVPYTEEELMEKQNEINDAVFKEKIFEDEGINVYFTSVDIIHNKVEIGIFPYTVETKTIVKEYFNDDMVEVVKGDEVQLLIDKGDGDDEKIEKNDKEEKVNFLHKIINWLRNLFSNKNS